MHSPDPPGARPREWGQPAGGTPVLVVEEGGKAKKRQNPQNWARLPAPVHAGNCLTGCIYITNWFNIPAQCIQRIPGTITWYSSIAAVVYSLYPHVHSSTLAHLHISFFALSSLVKKPYGQSKNIFGKPSIRSFQCCMTIWDPIYG